jgi:hypothetical protein
MPQIAPLIATCFNNAHRHDDATVETQLSLAITTVFTHRHDDATVETQLSLAITTVFTHRHDDATVETQLSLAITTVFTLINLLLLSPSIPRVCS